MNLFKRMLAAALAAALCLSAAVAMADGQVTTTGSVNLRRGPGLDYASIRAIDAGVALNWDDTSVDGRGVTWYRVRYNGNTGWVSSRYVAGGGAAENRITTTASVHLRAGAGVEYASRRVVDAGTTLIWDDADEDYDGATWYHVSYRGDEGWICARYTRRGGSGDADGGRVTTTGSVHLRSGAGLDYASRTTVPEGVALSYDKTALDGRGVTWYRVSYRGVTGWISSRYARKGGGSGETRTVRLTGSANIRSGPGLAFDAIGTASEGASLSYRGQTRRDERGVAWYSVGYRGDTGWVSSRYATLR